VGEEGVSVECGLRSCKCGAFSLGTFAGFWGLPAFIDVFKGYFSGEFLLNCLAFACLFSVDNNRLNSEWKGVDVERNQKAGWEGRMQCSNGVLKRT
jgi:hypothetical protein